MRRKACRRCELIDTAVRLRTIPSAQMLFRDVRAALLRMDGVSYRKITERVYGRRGLSKQAANNFSRKRIAKLILQKDVPCPKHAESTVKKRATQPQIAGVAATLMERAQKDSPRKSENSSRHDNLFESLEIHELLALRVRIRAALLRKGVR